MLRIPVLAIAIVVVHAAQSSGALVTVVAQSVGNYGTVGGHELDNYGLGNVGLLDIRNYAIFDLSGLGGTVISGLLQTDSGEEIMRDDDVDIFLRSYSGSIAALTAGTANFADLANGNDYSNLLIPGSLPNNAPVEFTLNPTAIADINAATGLFAIAGSQPVATTTAGVFADNRASEVSLVLDVAVAIPEPSSYAVIIGVAALAYGWRRRKK